jgi:hypothetical protein
VFATLVSALHGERVAPGSQKVSEFQYCKLKQVIVKVRISLLDLQVSFCAVSIYHSNKYKYQLHPPDGAVQFTETSRRTTCLSV